MSKLTSGFKTIQKSNSAIFMSFLFLLAFVMTSCSLIPSTSGETAREQAEIELHVQQTLLAQQVTQVYLDEQSKQAEIAIQSTQTAAEEQFKQTEAAFQAAQTAQAAEALAAQQAADQAQADAGAAQEDAGQVQNSQAAGDSAGTTSESAASGNTTSGNSTSGDSAAVDTTAEFSQEEFEAYMENSKILMYEDAVNAPWLARYVKDALDDMGLDYKDDGSAKGWLKSDLLSSQWDLVIIALESPTLPPTGEYFDLINQTLDNGSAVILEIWFLNYVSQGDVSKTLSRCGLELESDYGVTTYTYNDLINWPLPGKSDHPVLNEPNTGIRWTNIAAIRGPDDLGDFIKLSGKKDDAELLLGAIATEKNSHGTLAVCNNGKFIVQTFHTHNLAYEEALPLWQNYIYNTLKAKYLETQ